MAARVAWLNKARDQYRTITAYIAQNGCLETAYKFTQEIDQKLVRVCKYPGSGHLSAVEGVRYVIIYKRYNLYYRFFKDTIIVVYLWDTRRNPEKNPYKG